MSELFAREFTALAGIDIAVDRSDQLRAILCHTSQARNNPLLRRRLALLGSRERVRLNPLEEQSGGPREDLRPYCRSC